MSAIPEGDDTPDEVELEPEDEAEDDEAVFDESDDTDAESNLNLDPVEGEVLVEEPDDEVSDLDVAPPGWSEDDFDDPDEADPEWDALN